MIFATAMLLALVGAVLADHGPNELTLGSAVALELPEGASTCAIKLKVPAGTAKTGCKVRFRYDFAATTVNRFDKISAWVSTSGKGNEWADADAKAFEGQQFEIDCPAGDVNVGLKVTECKLCVPALGTGSSPFLLSTTIIQDSVPVITVPSTGTEWYGSTIVVPQDGTIVFKYATTTASQVAHFLIDKSASSAADNVQYFAGDAATTPADLIKGTEAMTTTAGAGASARAQINHDVAGSYQFVVVSKALTGKTELTIRFRLNKAPDTDPKLALVEPHCPQQVCSKDELKGCSQCAKNGCNWCGGLQSACVAGECSLLTDLIDDDDKCPDIKAECKKLKTCTECVGKKGCLYCDTGATFGFSTGECLSGVDDLGQSCNFAGSTFTKTAKTVAECNGASSLIASAAVLLVAVLTVF
jgi:hypothetical protein